MYRVKVQVFKEHDQAVMFEKEFGTHLTNEYLGVDIYKEIKNSIVSIVSSLLFINNMHRISIIYLIC